MSTFGRFFRVTTFGESHGGAVGCIVDGVPPRMPLVASDVQVQLDRRRPGQSAVTTDRQEGDKVEICSGTENGLTLGSPLTMLVRNQDHRPGDYSEMSQVPRPSHADFTYMAKYGINASSGGGRASARETIGRVAAGAVAELWLRRMFGTEIVAYVLSVGTIDATSFGLGDCANITRADVDRNDVRCPHEEAAAAMKARILELKERKDSTGGVVRCVIRNVPRGLGEPCFDKLEAMLAHAMLSIPSTKGFEIGSGFAGTRMTGSEHNDAFVRGPDGRLGTATNRSAGIQGGISNGESIFFSVAFKLSFGSFLFLLFARCLFTNHCFRPPATIGLPQETSSYKGDPSVLESRGRHDPCVVPRAIPIVEAMASLVLADAALAQLARDASSASFEKIFSV